jgi:O-antigen ligase
VWWFGLISFALWSPFSISGAQIALGLSFLAMVNEIRRGTVRPRWAGFEAPFLLLFLAGILSLGNAVDLGRGVSELRKFLIILPFWLPFWYPLTEKEIGSITDTLIASTALAGLVGAGKTLMAMQSLQERASGFFSMSLTFGEFMALVLMFTLVWRQREDDPGRRRLLLLAAACQGVGLISSMARGAMIGLVLGCAFLWRQYWRGVVLVMVIVAIGLGGFLVLVKNADSRFFVVRKDDWVRFRIWEVGFTLLAEKPVFGVGMNNIKPLYREKATPEEVDKKWIFGHQHNNFMQYLVMTGLFGFSVFCWWLLELGRFCLFPDPSSDAVDVVARRVMPMGLFALFLCFWGSGFTEYSFGDEEVAMLFFFLLGLLANPGPDPRCPRPVDS